MLLETILCIFGRVFATGNALMLPETILCKFGQICATGNAIMQLGATLYKSGQICETGNALMPLETILCKHGQICTKGNGLVRLEPNLCNWLLAGTPFWIFPPKFEPECAEPFYVVMTHQSSHSQGQSRKRLLLASRGHPIRTILYQTTCIDLTHQPHTLDLTPDLPFR